ncbi:hypothetical protein SAMN05216302_10468 [Nitrosomonas aestuarii]|uniref:Uncharacterized protein n=1 Tax=Nitrosomonas aestuarii TaxID=52441 RepID=A0A1I4G114_9PROT|nr:hypothetical protein [Nitrosomonas aestuarii]SFL23842.1 hypothetical protein SAMN05216302_10468 [Nitrosomonas aestuarii]
MKTLSDRVDEYLLQERSISNILDVEIALPMAVAATRFYAGYAAIESHADLDPAPAISPDTEISNSEWSVIRPLFVLYTEKESAIQLEATGMLGVGMHGRSSSEVGQEITQIEMEMPKRAFVQDIITV